MFFLAKDGFGRTAWHMASEKGKIYVLHKLWEWGKEILTPEDLNKLLLDDDIWGRTDGYLTAEKGHINVSQKLGERVKEISITEELNEMLLIIDGE